MAWSVARRVSNSVITSVALSALLLSGLGPASATPTAPSAAEAGVVDPSQGRPDPVSAMVTARAAGAPVEDLSARTVSERVLANPDGTWSLEAHSGPIHRENSAGELVPVDQTRTLEQAGRALVGAEAELVVTDGAAELGDGPTAGSVPLATVSTDHDGTEASMTLGWEGTLAAPVVQDNQAVFTEDVSVPVAAAASDAEEEPSAEDGPAADSAVEESVESAPTAPAQSESAGTEQVPARLMVGALSEGFGHQVVLDEDPGADVVVRFPIGVSKGLDVVQDPDNGSLSVVDAQGQTVFFGSAPMMWDAAVDEASGLPTAETEVETELLTEDGTSVLELTVPAEWLAAEDRQYPVVVDPYWTTAADADTYVQSNSSTPKGADPELRAGTYDAGTTKARSFVRFNTGALTGKHITSAEVRLWNHHSYSCQAATTTVTAVNAAWDPKTLVWSNQPAVNTALSGSNGTSLGYSSACEGGWVKFPATTIAQHWADNPTKNFGVRVAAGSETSNLGWKRYWSTDYTGYTYARPYLLVTYNSYPNTPSIVGYAAGQATTGADGKTYVTTKTPSLKAVVSDPDNNSVKAQFDLTSSGTTILNKQTGSVVSSGSSSTLKVPDPLVEGRSYAVKAWAHDGQLRSKAAGPVSGFTVDTIAPTKPTVSSTGYGASGWVETYPSSNEFTFTTTSTDTVKFEYRIDGGSTKTVAATGTGPKTGTLAWNAKGAHSLTVQAVDRAGLKSPVATYSFMSGLAGLTAPAAGSTTSDAFRVTASAPDTTEAVTAKVYWREAGANTAADTSPTGSTDTGLGWVEAKQAPVTRSGGHLQVDTTLDVATEPMPSDPKEPSKLAQMGKERLAALVEVQVCFTYPGGRVQCTTNKSAPATAVTRLPHAFGSNYPVTEAGDGQVALATGELNLSVTDVTADAGNTGLSIGRSYSSYSGLSANGKIFGDGWRATLDGPDAGLAGMLVAESTKVDGTITLVDEEETAMVFRQPDGTREANKTGVYTPANEDAVDSGLKLELTGTGTGSRIRVTEPDGTVTTFTNSTKVLAGGGVYEWVAESVTATGEPGKTLFRRNSDGQVTRIIAATTGATGQDATTACDTENPGDGCRVLNLAYTEGRLTAVTFTAYDPVARKMVVEKPMATYTYKTVGSATVLAAVKNERTGDVTGYDYAPKNSQAGVPLLVKTTQIAANGNAVVAPTEYGYGKGAGTGASDRPDWLEAVRRGNPDGSAGTVQVNRFAYGVPATGGTADGTTLPNLGAATTALWGQDDAPVAGAAVFDLTRKVGTSNAAQTGLGALSAEDFKFAKVVYWDGQNRVVNNAYHAAGGWQLDATVYNAEHLPVRQYSAQALASLRAVAAEDPTRDDEGAFTNHEQYATVTEYVEPVATLSEPAQAHVRAYPTTVSAPVVENERGGTSRRITTTAYTAQTDVDAGGMPRMLPTKVTTAESEVTVPGEDQIPADRGLSVTTNDYNAMEAFGGKTVTDKTNARSGWVHGTPTTVTTTDATESNPVTHRTWLDETGRTIRTAQPTSSGSDVGATAIVYYTAGANSANPVCGNRPEYAGRLCATVPMGTGSVTKQATGYNFYGNPTTVEETPSGAGTATRTTTTTYRDDGQVNSIRVAATGLPGSTPVSPVTYLYDAAGRKTGEQTSAGTVFRVLDAWGRTTAYTNQDGDTTTTTYNEAGLVAKTANDHGETRYQYGAVTNEAGSTEYRGLPTGMEITNHGSAGETGTYAATYDAIGNLVTQTMPGTMSQHTRYDTAGRQTGVSYHGPISGGGTGEWVSWSQALDVQGRIVTEATPDAITPGPVTSDGHAVADRAYTYDVHGRLAEAVDHATGTTRAYGFDANGNRTRLATTTPTGTTTKTWAWDQADRMTATGYVHDPLGRITTIPAADAPATGGTTAADQAGGAAITLDYYDTDAARIIKRGAHTTTIGLDATGRRHTLTSSTGGTTINGYADDSDNPAYTTHTSGGTATVTRYGNTIGGDLAITLEASKATLTLNNPHGDTVATLTLPGGTGAPTTGINSWSSYDEYGNPATTLPTTGPGTTYGWHGADQRATDSTGLLLMGARLYNPGTGQFTTRDPVSGGNTTPLTYPQDPVNQNDTSGLWRKCGNICKAVSVTSEGLAGIGCRLFLMGGIGCAALIGALTSFVTYVYQWQNDRRFSWSKAAWAAVEGALIYAVSASVIRLVGKALVWAVKKRGQYAAAKSIASAFDFVYRKPKHRK